MGAVLWSALPAAGQDGGVSPEAGAEPKNVMAIVASTRMVMSMGQPSSVRGAAIWTK